MSSSDLETVSLEAHTDVERETAATEASSPSTVTSGGSGSASSTDTGRGHTRSGDWAEPVARALHGEEVARARGWSTAVLVLTVTVLACVPVLPGERWNKIAVSASLVALAAAAGWCWFRSRDDASYSPMVFRVFGYVAATASFEIVYFLGVFSPTPLVVTLGITFFGMGMDRRHALAIPVYAILGYLVMALLIITGVLHDRGVITAEGVPIEGKLFFVGIGPTVLSLTLWMARVSRGTMATALAQAADATRLAAQREALLFEAQHDLEKLRQAGAGQSGRFTGSMAGRYELAEILGRGAMGEVYTARCQETDERVAIKLLRLDAMVKENMLERFLREGKTAGSLDAPNVVRVLGVGEIDPGGVPYIAMELLQGEDLAGVLRRERTLDRDGAVTLVTEIARGLEAAHSAGIVHRDLKPQNLFCHRASPGDQGIWKILDFGVSKLADSHGTLTHGAVVGTPGYMSPEQAKGADVDHRCDVFALGSVAYRAITGRPAFGGPDLPQVLYSIVYEQPPRPSALVERLPRDVDRVLALAMAKQPSDRFDSALAMANALERGFAGKLGNTLRRKADKLLLALPWADASLGLR